MVSVWSVQSQQRLHSDPVTFLVGTRMAPCLFAIQHLNNTLTPCRVTYMYSRDILLVVERWNALNARQGLE